MQLHLDFAYYIVFVLLWRKDENLQSKHKSLLLDFGCSVAVLQRRSFRRLRQIKNSLKKFFVAKGDKKLLCKKSLALNKFRKSSRLAARDTNSHVRMCKVVLEKPI